jgi:hypothetical protein
LTEIYRGFWRFALPGSYGGLDFEVLKNKV